MLTSKYNSPVGELLLGARDGRLCLCDWTASAHHARVLATLGSCAVTDADARCLDSAAAELDLYFAGKLNAFSTELSPVGSVFRQSVWRILGEVPYGSVMTYSALAAMLGRPSAVRAVASAVAANGISIFIPCHRIVSATGEVRYAGGADAKRYLLGLEQKNRRQP